MKRPNVLFIYSDQHRYDCVGVNGHPLIRTPNMDRVAAEGVNCTNAFTPIPMCVPARCSLLSGQWPARHGVIFNFDGETFKRLDPRQPSSPATIVRAGYHAIHIGRWHVDPQRTPLDFGFHDYVPSWRYGKWRSAQGIAPPPSDQGWRGQTDTEIAPEQSFLGWSADRVIRWIEQAQESTDPFFIRWHMAEPHLACRPPEPYASMYRPADIPPWPGFADSLEGKPRMQRQMRATWGVEGMSWDEWSPVVARYLGVISLLDSQIGRVLEALDRLGIADDTLVIYSADHGDLCGSHGMADKHYIMYDDVVRVPLMMRWPRAIPAGSTIDGFISNAVDFPPTLCEVAGADIPEQFQGISLLDAACNGAPIDREDIFASYSGNQFGSYTQRMVRNHRWKYVWNATAEDELYDMQADPGELYNRAPDPANADMLTDMRRRLVSWMEQTGDSILNPWTKTILLEGRVL